MMFFIIIFTIIEYQLVMNEILNRIKSLRTAKNLKQADFAKLINMTQGGYSKIELGETELTIERLYKIADVLSVNIEYLLFGENEDKSNSKSKEIESFKKEINTLSYTNNLQKEKLENISFKVNEIFKHQILAIIGIKIYNLIGSSRNNIKRDKEAINNEEWAFFEFVKKAINMGKITLDDFFTYYFNLLSREKEELLENVYREMQAYLFNSKINNHNYEKNLLVWLANYLFIGRNYSVQTAAEEEYFLWGFQRMYCYYCENNIITDEFLLELYRLFTKWEKFDIENYNNGKK